MKSRPIVAAATVILAAVAGAWWWISHRQAVPPPTAPPAYTRTFDRRAERLSGVVLVNEMPEARLAEGVPIYVQAALRNPTAGAIPLTSTPQVAVELRRSDGSVVPATFERVGDWPRDIAARGTAIVTWTLAAPVGAGVYEVGVTDAAAWPAGDAYQAMFSGARLEITAGADADQTEAAAIRLLILRGQAEAALTRLDAALARDDGHLLFQLWRADALELLNRRDEARGVLKHLGALVVERQRQAGKPIELPFWLAARLGGSSPVSR